MKSKNQNSIDSYTTSLLRKENESDKIKLFTLNIRRQDNKKNNEIQNEVGDIFFTLINIAKFVKVDAEEALRSTNNKFSKRFKFIEQEIKKNGRTLKESSLEEMEHYWQKAKSQ